VAASDLIVRFNIVATVVFGATAAYAAADFSTTAQWVGAVTAMALFTIGVVAFLWSYWTAVQRSREVDIAVSQLYLLLGAAIPKTVRRTMNLVLAAQFAIALATTFARPNGPDGNPGSSLAVGFLAIMLGFGLNGLWASQHGSFQTRRELADEHSLEQGAQVPASGADVPASVEEIGQNADHG
jgi:hypothetical protein